MEEETPKDTRERRRTTLRMPPLAREGKGSRKSKTLGEPDVVNRGGLYEAMELDSRLELIRSLMPLGLIALYGGTRAGTRQLGRCTAQPQAGGS